jgi:hypothetical protein
MPVWRVKAALFTAIHGAAFPQDPGVKLNHGQRANAHVSAPKAGGFPTICAPEAGAVQAASERASTPLTGLDANPHCPKNPAIPYALFPARGAMRLPVGRRRMRDGRVEEERLEIRSRPPRPDYGCEKENKWQRVL